MSERDEVAGRFGPIFDPTRSVVLVASAGTGKTWRLVRRYLRIIAGADPQSPDGRGPWALPREVVAVTFTRAAAAEMRARVFAALTASAGSSDPEDDPVLAEILALRSVDERLSLAEQVAAAPIGTLHSLCARMLGEFPELSGVPPDARPLEPAEQSLELASFVQGWLDRVLDDPGHRAHGGCVELLRVHPLGFVRRELRAMVDGFVDPRAGWADADAIQAAREAFVRTQWDQYFEAMMMPLSALFAGCVNLGQRGPVSDKQRELTARIQAVSRHLGGNVDLRTVVEDVAALRSIRPSKALGELGPLLQQFHNIERVTATRRKRPVMPDPDACLDRAQADHLERWIELASEARADWSASLRERAVLRYDDLELLAGQLLADPRAKAQLRGRYRHLLVDEYQDINPIQAEIIAKLRELCGPDPDAPGSDEPATRVFFVGDPKQSIYRFRGADPEVFQQAEVAVEGGRAVVELAQNRRSSPTLARFFAQLFPPLFAGVLPWANTTQFGRPQELAVLREVKDHAVVPWDHDIVTVREGDRLPGLAVDLLLRDRSDPADDPELAEEAVRVATHLRGLLAGATLDSPEGAEPAPRLRAREIAILVPRWYLAEDYRAALEDQGIAADLAGGRGLLLLPEVRDLINLVRLCADERDELAALAVLRGPCFAISDLGLYVLARWPGVDRRVREADPDLPEFAELDELWEPWDEEGPEEVGEWPRARPRGIRHLLRHGRLDPERALAALVAAEVIADDSPQRRAELRARLEADAAALEDGRDRFRDLVRHAGARATGDLLADLVAEFRLEAHWLAGPRGRRAVANAWRFVEHVRSLEPEGPDLQRLSAWLDAGAEPAPEGLISPEADAVTITTWHGSKGKEWPVVVVAGLGEFRQIGARTSWSRAPIPTLDSEHGHKLPVPRIGRPHRGFAPEPDPLQEPCANMLAPLEAAEAKRLLYVAMTRARDRLVLSGAADPRAHVHWEDKPWLGLPRGFDMDVLFGEPKPAYLCKRPIELLVAGLDLLAARGGTHLLRPRAAAWSLSHLRVIDDAMLRAGRERAEAVEAERAREEHENPNQSEAASAAIEPDPSSPKEPARGRAREAEGASEAKREPDDEARQGPPEQLSLTALFGAPSPEGGPDQGEDEADAKDDAGTRASPPPSRPAPVGESPPDLLRWRAGPTMQIWQPSAGRSPWPVSTLEWDMPLPARRPALLDDEDPRRLGDLFHAAMELWDLDGDPPSANRLTELAGVRFANRDPAELRRITAWLSRCLDLFAKGELIEELRAARARGQLFHEVELDALIPPDAPGDDAPSHRITGRIDLLWRGEDGRWNVLDYKVTAKVRSRAQMEELTWEYGPQLLLYRKALERWRPRGELVFCDRFGLWLATAGKVMWMR